MKMPVRPDTTGKVQRWVTRETVKYEKAYKTVMNRLIKESFDAGECIRFDVAKAHASNNYNARVKAAITHFDKIHTSVPSGYIVGKDFVVSLGYNVNYSSTLYKRANIGEAFRLGGVVYLSPEQCDILTAYRIEAEKFSWADMRRDSIEASKRGRSIGLQAERFGKNGIRGNYFSDYVTDNFGAAEYERYVNRKERIDAFTVVDGVAHIIEFKTGNVNPMNHKAQVLRYAKGIRDEGYSAIKVVVLYYDNRDHNVSWDVNVDELDEEYRKVVDYIASMPSRIRGTV